ncbi:hypothetical protein CLCR_11028 [Cladophialophora carrionii]|uniref:Uncharacterized protein n=1 Tax=Cladophialophora carrionii TaxID=86049 RepID=A0A1C1CYE4_9EURO|nr:hypothetical protein CLCR_11028 [Cladophialophora carrionii]
MPQKIEKRDSAMKDRLTKKTPSIRHVGIAVVDYPSLIGVRYGMRASMRGKKAAQEVPFRRKGRAITRMIGRNVFRSVGFLPARGNGEVRHARGQKLRSFFHEVDHGLAAGGRTEQWGR